MFNLQTIIDVVNFISNKEQTGKTLTTAQINTVLSEINIEAFNILYKEYESGQRNKDSLSPFIKVIGENETAEMIINEYGVASLPTDYAHAITGGIGYKWIKNNEDETFETQCKKLYTVQKSGNKSRIREITMLMDSEVMTYLSDANKRPTLENPCCVIRNGYIQFYPSTLQRVIFTYFRYPVNPVYVTTQDMQTLLESYDSVNSVNFEYKDEDYPLLIALFCINIGINLNRKELIEVAQLKMQTL